MLNLDMLSPITFSEEQLLIIKSFGKLEVKHWDLRRKLLRDRIRDNLCKLQNGRCVYCGCEVTGDDDVEHIAHKAVHTQFMFTPLNLAYSCSTCNQRYKGSTEVVAFEDPYDYKKCVFKIVHPYLDDVDRYFDTSKIIIRVREGLNENDRKKAKFTVDLFHWTHGNVIHKRTKEFAENELYQLRGETREEYIAIRDKCEEISRYNRIK